MSEPCKNIDFYIFFAGFSWCALSEEVLPTYPNLPLQNTQKSSPKGPKIYKNHPRHTQNQPKKWCCPKSAPDMENWLPGAPKWAPGGGRRLDECLRDAWGMLGGCLRGAWSVAREDRYSSPGPRGTHSFDPYVLTHLMTWRSVDYYYYYHYYNYYYYYILIYYYLLPNTINIIIN